MAEKKEYVEKEGQRWFEVDQKKPWFTEDAGWPNEVPKNMLFPTITLGQMLQDTVKKYPNEKAIWFLESFITYKELYSLVESLATALHKLGLKKGDVIALLLPNSIQYVVAYYAAQLLGVTASGINPTYKPREAEHQLKLTGAKALVVLDSLYEQIVEPIIGETKVEHVIVTNVVDLVKMSPAKKFLGKLLKKIPTGRVPADALKLTKLLQTPANVPDNKVHTDDIAAMITTGGTTGVPKAAVLTHFNLVSNALQSKAWLYKVEPGGVAIGVLPLFHSFAMTCVMNISIAVGAWMLLFPRPPQVDELLKKIQELVPQKKGLYPGAEILFKRIAEFPDINKYDVAGRLELCVSGAGPLHRPVQEAFEKATGGRLSEGYGLTESSPVVSAGPFWGKRKVGTIGLPFPGTDWKIVDIADWTKELSIGEVGEVAVSGPQVMKEYYNQPEETTATIVWGEDGKRWLLTGDIGRMDEGGSIIIEDRKKQLIKYRGYSVFPTEVETLLYGNEAVGEVAVGGIPDPTSGEIIKAWIVVKPEYKDKVTPQDIIEWAKQNLTHYKVPAEVEFRDELPKTLVGKVLRRVLQEEDPRFQEYKAKKKT